MLKKDSQINFEKPFQRNAFKNILVRYKSVLVLLLVCGFNYKVFRLSRKCKIIANIYCTCLVILTIVSTLYCCDVTNNTLVVWPLIEYIVSVAILIFYDSKLTKFSSELSKIDSFLKTDVKYYIRGKKLVFILIFILWIVRLCFMIIFCFLYCCYTEVGFFIVSMFSCLALDVHRIWRFLLLEIVRYRFRFLRQNMKEILESSNISVSDQRTIKKNKIKLCNTSYKGILDVIDLISPELTASMFVSIICSLPKLISNSYHILLVFEKHEPLQSIGFVLIHMFHTCFLLFAPCVVVELQFLEIDRIRLILINRLLEETDPKIKEDIQMFIQYTDVRKYQSKIWRVIPFNIALPIEVANICVSSVIVLINFTHLYD